MIDVCILGNGGMMPLPERPLSATLLRIGSDVILFDCGENTQVNWRVSSFGFRRTSVILLSHLHADHIAGLPGVLFQIAFSGRRDTVTIVGPAHTLELLQHFLIINGRIPFELRVIECSGGESLELVDGCSIRTLALSHRADCLGYRIDVPRARRFDPERARDLGVPQDQWSELQHGEAVGDVQPDDVLGPERPGLSVALITDTRVDRTIAPFVADADLLIIESMYAEDTDAEMAGQRGHLTARQAATIGSEANVRRLWLTHFSPRVEHIEQAQAIAREVYPEAIAVTPGLAVTLAFED